jgi:hypothetical protein
MTGPSDARLERLFGEGAVAFQTAFDLVPDPVGVLWAIRDRGGRSPTSRPAGRTRRSGA